MKTGLFVFRKIVYQCNYVLRCYCPKFLLSLPSHLSCHLFCVYFPFIGVDFLGFESKKNFFFNSFRDIIKNFSTIFLVRGQWEGWGRYERGKIEIHDTRNTTEITEFKGSDHESLGPKDPRHEYCVHATCGHPPITADTLG